MGRRDRTQASRCYVPSSSSAGAGALFNASGSNFHMLFVIIPEGSQQGHPGVLACFSR